MSGIAAVRNELVFENKKKVLVHDHDTADIIKWICKVHPGEESEYDKVAMMHWQGNAEKTARHLFDFCKKNIHYRCEDAEDQTIKAPGAILGHGYGDCKHYASYINGVFDSLRRQGKPVTCKYRFTADKPNIPVHHVFAVVGDGTNEWWDDPVVDRFDKRPNYHNVKNYPMPLSYVSGTTAIGYTDYIGKHKHKNILKEIVHGAKVNVHNIKHGLDVNAANAGKLAKEGLKDIKTLTLKVGMVPARGAFLGLLDINAFNIAHHLYDAIKAGKGSAIDRQWKDIGGDTKKLANAITNGYKNYLKHHGQGAAASSVKKGVIRGIGYRIGGAGCGSYIGVGGVDDAALIALASSVIALFKKFFKSTPAEDAEMAAAAKRGAHALADHVTNGIDMANGPQDQADALNTLATAPGASSMQVSTGIADDGTPQINVHAVDHPAVMDAGTTAVDPGADDPGATPVPAAGPVQGFTDTLMRIWTGFKVPIVLGAGGVVAYQIATHMPRKRRR